MKFISASLVAPVMVALLTAATVVAGPGHGRRPGMHGPAAPEVRAYYQQNVLPVVRQQRQKLEGQLTTPDKARLASYRSQLKDLRERGQALHKARRAASSQDGGARPALTEAQKQQRQQLHTEMKAVMSQVKALAEKYEDSIRKLADEVAPQQEKWTADIKALGARSAAAPHKADLPAGRPGRHGRGHSHRSGTGRPFSPARFLLMSPAAPVGKALDAGSTMYPNPAGAASQLEYRVKKAGPVSIDLLDAKGSKLRTVLQEVNQEKGGYSQALSLDDLPSGTYYYKITTPSGSETRRFVKE